MAEAAGLNYTLSDRRGAAASGRAPVVLVHGAGGSRLQWPPQLRRMPGQAVYSLDLPGHGRSPGPGETTIEGYAGRLLSWARQVDLGPVVFVGHSMGGAIALLTALVEPERAAGLVLIGTGARLRVHPSLLELTASATGLAGAIEMVMAMAFGPNPPTDLARRSGAGFAETPAAVLHGDFSACDRFDAMERLKEIRGPALVICGREDRLTPLKYSQRLAEGISGARLAVVEEAGHMVMLERPPQVAAAIQGFLGAAFPGG